jgi:hypothetical protein
MSRTFLHLFKDIFKTMGNELSPKAAGIISFSITAGHFAYAVGTKREKEINIVSKYQFTRNGFTEFMIIDSEGNHYNVNNSFWYWKWDSIEDWSSIEANKKINTKYYGFRVPILGIFPNIVSSNYTKNEKNIIIDNSLQQDLSDGKFS